MKIKRIAAASLMFAAPLLATASGTATIACEGNLPIITLSYFTGADVGLPGVTYVGLVSPQLDYGLMLDMSNQWSNFTSGQLLPNGAFDSGLPAQKMLKFRLPNSNGNPSSTASFVNYKLYAGHGALTAKEKELVQKRREALNKTKDIHVAKGAWLPQYQDDDFFKLTLAQKNMTEGNKYYQVLTVPILDCSTTFSGG